jgi:hypothetical protein
MTDITLKEADRLMQYADDLDARAERLRADAMECRQDARRYRARANRESTPRTPSGAEACPRTGKPLGECEEAALCERCDGSVPRDPHSYRGIHYGVQARNTDEPVDRSPLEPHTINGDAATIAGGPDGFGPGPGQARGPLVDDLDPPTDTAESVQADAEVPSRVLTFDQEGGDPRDARPPSGEYPPRDQWDRCSCGARWNPSSGEWTDGRPEGEHVLWHGYGSTDRCPEVHSILNLRCVKHKGHADRHRVFRIKSGQAYSWFAEAD